MVTKHVKKNVTNDDTFKQSKWPEALADAQLGLQRAQKDVAQWKGTIAVIQRKIKAGSPWPHDDGHNV